MFDNRKCRYSVVVRVFGWVCEGPRFNPGRCQVHGLGVRHFKVSGGVPSPPEQPKPNGRLSESKIKQKKTCLIIEYVSAGSAYAESAYGQYTNVYIYIYIYTYIERDIYIYISLMFRALLKRRLLTWYGRFPKCHRVFLGRDPGTLKFDIVSKKHPQLICSDLRLSNWKFEDWNYGNRPYGQFTNEESGFQRALPEQILNFIFVLAMVMNIYHFLL